MSEIEIKAIEIENGFFVKSSRVLTNFILNGGMKTQKSYDSGWLFVPRKITDIKSIVKGERINERYELKNPEMVSDHIPLIMPKDEVMCCSCKSFFCGCEWTDDYSHLRSLYKEAYELEEDTMKDEEFTWSIYGKSDKSFSRDGFEITREGSHYNDYRPTKYNIVEGFKYTNLEDSMLYPSVLKSTLPCKLSRSSWYNVVRYHIKARIDSRYAHITSDYDFCLTVKKRVLENVEDIVLYGKKRTLQERDITIFECAPKGYQSYTVIDEIKGDDYSDLVIKIKKYLHELMVKINTPTYKCDCCDGYGYIVKS